MAQSGTFFKKTSAHAGLSILLIIIGIILYAVATYASGLTLMVSAYIGLVLFLVGIIWLIGMATKGKSASGIPK